MNQPDMAPPWRISEWLNTPVPIDLEAQRGHVVVALAFQMLCPGCVAQAIPQMKAVHELFGPQGVVVVGLHTVFEHHDVMGPEALEVFLHEYRVTFPVAVDHPGALGDAIPQTMQAYRMRGTPTVILIDAVGRIRQHVFGVYDDLRLGRDLGALIAEAMGGWTSKRGETVPLMNCEISKHRT